ncbi:hypothetical protein V6U90_11320 [Micromonospora sp. CPCC 206060]|uniref:hypothetical protein n=1 Tax=Micromonospora sp. CPCC 206060 TaxID=3122406 RepID=UPI002FF00FF7
MPAGAHTHVPSTARPAVPRATPPAPPPATAPDGRAVRRGRALPALTGPVLLVTAALPLVSGCGTGTEPTPPPAPPPASTTGAPPGADVARDQLAALAAAAQDRHLTATYRFNVPGRPERTVTVTNATDDTWRVDIPQSALGGTADIALARTGDGLFQCALPSGQLPTSPGCVRVADPDGDLPGEIDPRVQHPFTDWLRVLTDRQSALSVSVTRPLPGASGTCFSVESTSASLNSPVDVGIYCFAADGTLTGVRAAFGSLSLAGTPAAGPATVSLPGQLVDRGPLGLAAPPAPADGVPTDGVTATP